MHRRQPIPRLWLFTDERQGEALMAAVERLPRGAGIVFRHYALPDVQRRALFERVRAVARRRGLTLLLAGKGKRWGADGSHGRGRAQGFRSAPAHSLKEIRDAERNGASLLFLSPVFSTRSHPGGRTLGLVRFAGLVQSTRLPVVALGGMNPSAWRRISRSGAYGWAAIDAWSQPRQKRKAVPT